MKPEHRTLLGVRRGVQHGLASTAVALALAATPLLELAARPAPATDEEDPLASLPADFAAFSLTQTHPRSGDAKAEPFEQQRQQGSRVRRVDVTERESTHAGTRRASASTAISAPTARAAASSRMTSRN